MRLLIYVALPVLVWALVLLSVTACASPTPRIVTKEVRVPVVARCDPAIPAAPAYAADAVDLDGTIFELVKALLIDREQRKAHELELRAAAEGCR